MDHRLREDDESNDFLLVHHYQVSTRVLNVVAACGGASIKSVFKDLLYDKKSVYSTNGEEKRSTPTYNGLCGHHPLWICPFRPSNMYFPVRGRQKMAKMRCWWTMTKKFCSCPGKKRPKPVPWRLDVFIGWFSGQNNLVSGRYYPICDSGLRCGCPAEKIVSGWALTRFGRRTICEEQ